MIGGGLVKSVSAATGSWDPARPTEGAYSALLTFENGAFASVTYSGYGHFDSDELMGGIDEMGQQKDARPLRLRRARRFVPPHNSDVEAALKNARNYGGSAYKARCTDVQACSISISDLSSQAARKPTCVPCPPA